VLHGSLALWWVSLGHATLERVALDPRCSVADAKSSALGFFEVSAAALVGAGNGAVMQHLTS